MLEESGRRQGPAGTVLPVMSVGEATAVAAERPKKRLRLSGKQTVGAEAARMETKYDKPPCCSVERSRSQVLFRTGKRGPGQTTAIPYGKGAKYADEHAALVVAHERVIEAKSKRGMLPCA